eukprot:c19361_g1_i1 orf=90-743(+)
MALNRLALSLWQQLSPSVRRTMHPGKCLLAACPRCCTALGCIQNAHLRTASRGIDALKIGQIRRFMFVSSSLKDADFYHQPQSFGGAELSRKPQESSALSSSDDLKLSSNDCSLDSEEKGPKVSTRRNLAILFTCKVCQTRSAKTMSRDSYEKGIVIVRCGGCENLHLIADRFGWFGTPGSVEDFLAKQGVEIRKGSEESYEFSFQDLTGWTVPEGR